MLPRRPHSPLRAATLWLTLLATACATAPPSSSPLPPAPRVTASQRATPGVGTALPGAADAAPAPATLQGGTLAAATGSAEAQPDAPPRRYARVELVRFPTRLSRDLPRVTDELVAVLADDGTRALRPASLWFGEARHSVPDALWNGGRATGLWQALAVWEGDEQLVLQLDEPTPRDDGRATRLRVELRPAAPDATWSVGLVASGPRPDADAALADIDSDDPALRPDSFVELRAERLLMRPLPATSERALTLMLPSPWSDGWIGLRLTPVEPHEAFARTAIAAAEARRAVVLPELAPPAPTSRPAKLGDVLRAGLARGETRRATLQQAASAARLPLLSELCLTAPRSLVDRIAQRASARLEAGEPVVLRTLLGALLDALANQVLDAEAGTRVDAVLREHLGALDRRRSLLADALPSFVDDAALEAFLRRENALLLDDSRPDTRLRAFEFLARRKLAPAGYDPLGTRAERRAALEAAAAAETRP